MLERFRGAAAAVIAPIARLFLRWGLSPDLITVLGTLGVVIGALLCFPMGWLWQGVVVVTFFVFSDMIDGQMAKMSGNPTRWGAFLDSSLDRLGDGAVFGGVVLYFAYRVDQPVWAGIALWALVFGQLTSYVRARAESLGFSASGGLAARADRLLIILAGLLLAGLGVPHVLELAVAFLAAASTVTVLQRFAKVKAQSLAEEGPRLRPATGDHA